MFITFEGIDGCGKSTQAKELKIHLETLGHEVVLTREPGGSPGAEEIRTLLLEGDTERWSAITELLLFNAARRDHLERVILPNQEQGKIVISDRFADSTRIYQGVGRDNLRELADQVHSLVIGHEPDLTVIIDINPEDGIHRAQNRGGEELRFEGMGLDMQQRMRKGFLALAEEFPERCVVISGEGSIQEVSERLWVAIRERL